jgi:Outer membrane protein beta-barrel domain
MYKSILRISIILCFLAVSNKQYAGTFNIGLMAGVNASLSTFQLNQTIKNYDSKLGYNANAFAQIGLAKFIIQPELGYLNNRSSFTFFENGQSVDANLNLGQMYATGMLGLKLAKIRITTGPICTYTTTQSSDPITSSQQTFLAMLDNSKNLSWGGVFNVGVDITKKWSVDARVMRMLTSSDFNLNIQNTPTLFQGNTGMVSVSLGYSIFKLK